MTRFETIGRIVAQLHTLDDDALEDLLAEVSGEITDETAQVITRGSDDTKHLPSSPTNAEDLERAKEELKGYKLLTPEHAA